MILSIVLIIALLPLCKRDIRAEETADEKTITQTQNEEKSNESDGSLSDENTDSEETEKKEELPATDEVKTENTEKKEEETPGSETKQSNDAGGSSLTAEVTPWQVLQNAIILAKNNDVIPLTGVE